MYWKGVVSCRLKVFVDSRTDVAHAGLNYGWIIECQGLPGLLRGDHRGLTTSSRSSKVPESWLYFLWATAAPGVPAADGQSLEAPPFHCCGCGKSWPGRRAQSRPHPLITHPDPNNAFTRLHLYDLAVPRGS